MKIIGKATIHPFLFYSGKISGYSTWVLFFLSLIKIYSQNNPSVYISILSVSLFTFGFIISITSMFNLGSSTRLGLPAETTHFKSSGLYKFSRNPMYLGFNLLTISSMIYLHNIPVAILGIYSLFIYHLIIISEEKFLFSTFGETYIKYKNHVRRYI